MADYPIRWVAALDATVATTYKIYSDESTPGTFALEATISATNRGDGSYTPFQSTLSSAITATAISLTLADSTNFANSEYVVIDGEMILLGGKSGSTFASCLRGVGGSVKSAHLQTAVVYKAHESADVTIASFGARKVIRVRVRRNDGGLESVAAQAAIIIPTPPPDNGHATVYGLLQTPQGSVASGVTVSMTIAASGAYFPSMGSVVYKQAESATTDTDGYFEFFVPKTSKTEADKAITITIGSPASVTWSITSIPDVDSINFLET